MPTYEHKGLKLHYEVKGNPEAKETVAFFNGVMASTASWNDIVPIFEKLGFRIVLHDFKGQLLSDKPDGPYTFEEHCHEANGLFQHLNIESLHIIGTSYGGEIAMAYAMLYPEHTKSIAIIDSVSEIDPILERFLMGWHYMCDANDGEAFFWSMAPSIYGARFLREKHEMLTMRAKAFSNVDPSYFKGQKILYETFLKHVTMTDRLHTIQCPAMVVCGEDDLLKRPHFSKIIADHIPDSEFVLLPDCGHVAIFEKPKELQTLLAGFILKHQ